MPTPYRLAIRLSFRDACPIVGWSGSVAYSIAVDTLRRGRFRDRLHVSPLFRGDRPLLTGVVRGDRRGEAVLGPGDEAWFWAMTDEHNLYWAISSLAERRVARIACGDVEVVEVAVEAVDVRPSDRYGKATVDVEFYPTAFMFRGLDVRWPSPARLAYSLAKSYGEAHGLDLRQAAEAAAKSLEVLGGTIRPVRVDIGKGRLVPAFMGRARIAIYGNVGLWTTLLEWGQHVGVGVSRAIGLGRYRVLEVRGLA